MVKGRVPWPVQSTVAAALMAGVILALTIVVLVAWKKGASKRARVDKAARCIIGWKLSGVVCAAQGNSNLAG